jgi:hypothetical protein
MNIQKVLKPTVDVLMQSFANGTENAPSLVGDYPFVGYIYAAFQV